MEALVGILSLQLSMEKKMNSDSWVSAKGPQQRPKHLSYVDAVKSHILTGANNLPIKQTFSIFGRIKQTSKNDRFLIV
jgi:hypothetical protein